MNKFLKCIFSIEKLSNATLYKFLGFKIKLTNKEAKFKNIIAELEQNIEAMIYMQNFLFDIENLPKAKGDLRKLQNIYANFLFILINILEKYNLSYWVDFGTLLGTIRHKGFIPWDDDMDISMLRKDYIKLPDIFEKELSQYGFSIRLDSAIKIFWDLSNGQRLFLCDIYPYDQYYKQVDNEIEKKELDIRNKHCYDEFLKVFDLSASRKIFAKYNEKNFNNIQRLIQNLKNTIVMKNRNESLNGNIFIGAEILPYGYSNNYTYETVFPLKKMCFEDFNVSVPNNYDKYLKTLYGNYWLFPQNSVRNHLTEALDVLAGISNIDLDEVLKTIEKIKCEIISQNLQDK